MSNRKNNIALGICVLSVIAGAAAVLSKLATETNVSFFLFMIWHTVGAWIDERPSLLRRTLPQIFGEARKANLGALKNPLAIVIQRGATCLMFAGIVTWFI